VTLDAYLASHILLLLDPPSLNQSLRSFLRLIRLLKNIPPRTMESRMDGVDLRIHRRDGLRRGLRLPFAAWHAVFLNSG
jgi:hypothetical protein